MKKLRWNPSVLFRGNEVKAFWQEHYRDEKRKTLFILGKGFDVRMNIAIEDILNSVPNLSLETWVIEFDEGPASNSNKYQTQVHDNVAELKALLKDRPQHSKRINVWDSKSKSKRKRVGDRQAAQLLSSFDQISEFTDVIIDISSLPRGIYFSLVGKFLAFIDAFSKDKIPNLFVIVSENAQIDMRIKEREIDEDVGYLHGFGGNLELASEANEPIIWFPILGEDKAEHLDKAYTFIGPHEICPVLPFPSKNPRRSDSLIIDYHQLLFDKLSIEPQNIMYVPEQNPFEAYIRLTNAIRNYFTSLTALNGCRAIISTFSSKLLSIGSLLYAYELKNDIGVAILNVDSQGYEVESIEGLKNLKEESELFVIWLTGEPYDEASAVESKS